MSAAKWSIRPRTIRGWLRAGFGATLCLLALAGAVSIAALRDANERSTLAISELAKESESVQQVVTAVLREIVAGTRFVDTGDSTDERRYLTLVDEADKLRRAAMGLARLQDALGALHDRHMLQELLRKEKRNGRKRGHEHSRVEAASLAALRSLLRRETSAAFGAARLAIRSAATLDAIAGAIAIAHRLEEEQGERARSAGS